MASSSEQQQQSIRSDPIDLKEVVKQLSAIDQKLTYILAELARCPWFYHEDTADPPLTIEPADPSSHRE